MKYQKLFNYMKDEHDITLLQSDIYEIRNIVMEEETKQCQIANVGKRFSCNCAEPTYNYPEMLWCESCGKPIEDKVRISLDEGSAVVTDSASGKTKNALNEMAKQVKRIFNS